MAGWCVILITGDVAIIILWWLVDFAMVRGEVAVAASDSIVEGDDRQGVRWRGERELFEFDPNLNQTKTAENKKGYLLEIPSVCVKASWR